MSFYQTESVKEPIAFARLVALTFCAKELPELFVSDQNQQVLTKKVTAYIYKL